MCCIGESIRSIGLVFVAYALRLKAWSVVLGGCKRAVTIGNVFERCRQRVGSQAAVGQRRIATVQGARSNGRLTEIRES